MCLRTTSSASSKIGPGSPCSYTPELKSSVAPHWYSGNILPYGRRATCAGASSLWAPAQTARPNGCLGSGGFLHLPFQNLLVWGFSKGVTPQVRLEEAFPVAPRPLPRWSPLSLPLCASTQNHLLAVLSPFHFLVWKTNEKPAGPNLLPSLLLTP